MIAQDLETIQQEGFNATRMVDPNMVLHKKDDKEYEEQKGWIGRILPFELVQQQHLTTEWTRLNNKCSRLDEATASIAAILDELPEEEHSTITKDDGTLSNKDLTAQIGKIYATIESDEISALETLLQCSSKQERQAYIAAHAEVDWQAILPAKDGTYSKKELQQQINHLKNTYKFEEESSEAKMIALLALSTEVKKLKSEIRRDEKALHEHTKETIEQGLSDDDIRALLTLKWIDTLCQHLLQLPHTLVETFAGRLSALGSKYATTLVAIEHDIQEASQQLSSMIDQLTGSEYDMAALAEFKKLLANDAPQSTDGSQPLATNSNHEQK